MSAPAPAPIRDPEFLPRRFSQTVCSPGLGLAIAFAAALFWLIPRLAILHWLGRPYPFFHDEMSYLLGADTFAHGRLANPPLPLGRFFESPHILVTPTYMTKYQPGQSLWLALGQIVFGTPFAGVILEGFCMVASFGLMFGAWVSPKWAALFSFASALCFQWPMYWVNSYWGGCLAAMGAALVLTAAGRFLKSSGPKGLWDSAGLLLASGILLLWFTRPYEGGVLTICVLVAMLWRRSAPPRWLPLTVSAVPFLTAGFGWSLYYNQAVTGHALELPYLLYDRTFDTGPTFWFLPLHPQPHFDQPRLALQHGAAGWEVAAYHQARLSLLEHCRKVIRILPVVLGPLFGFVALLPFVWKDDRCRFLTPIVVASSLASCLVVWPSPHYMAPAITALLLLCAAIADSLPAASIRLVRRWWAVALIVLSAMYNTVRSVQNLRQYTRESFERTSMIDDCLKVPGKHLVLVRYQPGLDPRFEWVYNGANLNSQRVILAHDLGRSEDKLIENFYPDRTVWMATVSQRPPYEVLYTLRRQYSEYKLRIRNDR